MEILCIGHATLDLNLYLPEFPVENSKYEIQEVLESGGGPAANAACLLGLWGCDVGFAGLLGMDARGHQLLEEFKRFRVDPAMVVQQEGHETPFSVILVNNQSASRTIINRNLKPRFLIDPATWGKVTPQFCLMDGHELEAGLQVLEKFPRILSVLDAGSVRPGTLELSRRVTYVVASERFASQLLELTPDQIRHQPENTVNSLARKLGRPVAVTFGELGVYTAYQKQTCHLPAHSVKAVDTTGAGDIFHGAFVYALARKFSFLEALRWGNAAAGLSVTRKGARASIPSLQEVQKLLDAP